jgi:hypothetical protein
LLGYPPIGVWLRRVLNLLNVLSPGELRDQLI